jgi:TetR/AcrR family transcriptional regulator
MADPQSRKDRKRVAILRSAAAAFRRRGYHGASMEEIAEAIGMTKGNLYHYFKDKDEILFVCHDYSLDLLLARLREIDGTGSSADARLRQLIEGFVHMIIDELHGTALTLDFQALSPARLRKVIAKRDRFDRAVRGLISEGIASGVFAHGDPKLLSFAVLGAVNWIPRWFDPAGRAHSDEIARVFAAYLVDGLRPRGPRGTRAPKRTRTSTRGTLSS